MLDNQKNILSVENLTKSFGGIKALDNMQFDLQKGEVHAVMGENGAGKSTFMKILAGLILPDSSCIYFENEPLKNNNVHELLKKGISMIHQEIMTVPELSIAQNIFLGRENLKSIWLNDRDINEKAAELLNSLGLNISPTIKIKQLSIAQQQLVEIAKAISNDARIIIMDEPTSALSESEIKSLFKIINELKAKGVAIIYISHKMEEIFEITDRVTVLRDGQYIITKPKNEITENELINWMVGREVTNIFQKTDNSSHTAFSVSNLGRNNKFENISFEVKAGEVLGIAGLMGAGRTEIARAIFGIDAYDKGEIWMEDQKATIKSPKDAIKLGIGYLGEDRKKDGFFAQHSIKNNISIASLQLFTKKWFVNSSLEADTTTSIATDLKLKYKHINQKITELSGGNQQKVVLAKVLLTKPKVLILDEPTRGIDIAAKFEIYKLITELKAKGMAIILISSEMNEIIGLSDRVMVIAQGKQQKILLKSEINQENIMRYAIN